MVGSIACALDSASVPVFAAGLVCRSTHSAGNRTGLRWIPSQLTVLRMPSRGLGTSRTKKCSENYSVTMFRALSGAFLSYRE